MAIRLALLTLRKILMSRMHIKAMLFPISKFTEIQEAIRNHEDVSSREACQLEEKKLDFSDSDTEKPQKVLKSWSQIISKLINHKENQNE